MKKFLRYGLLLAGLMTLSATARAAETYTLDPMHTAVVWTINHFDFSHPWGKFSMLTGTLVLDQENPKNSSVKVTIPVANIVTGIDALDKHLKSKDFFDVATYPDATFVSDKVVQTGAQTAEVEGTLTMHGVSKKETLNITLNKIGENMFKKKTAGFSATATVKRSDYGLMTYLPGLGDEVKLYVESEANL